MGGGQSRAPLTPEQLSMVLMGANMRLQQTQSQHGGQPHEEIALCYQNLGECHNQGAQYDEALRYYALALEMFAATVGERHTYYQRCKKAVDAATTAAAKSKS